MLENRFFNDEKIAQLSAIETRLYLYLLTVASDLNQDSYTLHTNLVPSYFRLRTESTHNALIRFESLQLLSIAKSAPNTIQNKTKEDEAIEGKQKIPVAEHENLKTEKTHWFSDFVINEVKTLDTGIIKYARRVDLAFIHEEGFRAWFGDVANTKIFKETTPDGQIRYFKKALESELKSRGV